MNARFDAFVASVELAFARDVDEASLVAMVERSMADLVAIDDWLPHAAAQPHPRYYQQHLLHLDEQRRFSIVSFVWGPGQYTPVHDHLVWGVVGMLRGSECSSNYSFHGDQLVAVDEAILVPGDVLAFRPATGDIHAVKNASQTSVSISIHCYGGDIGRQPRHVYDPTTSVAKEFISGYSSITGSQA